MWIPILGTDEESVNSNYILLDAVNVVNFGKKFEINVLSFLLKQMYGQLRKEGNICNMKPLKKYEICVYENFEIFCAH
jgi:hypothetical protein